MSSVLSRFILILMALVPESSWWCAFYQRRGGIDITPWRSSEPLPMIPSVWATVVFMTLRLMRRSVLSSALLTVALIALSLPSSAAPGLTENELKAVFFIAVIAVCQLAR
jgi:hypothetical protein